MGDALSTYWNRKPSDIEISYDVSIDSAGYPESGEYECEYAFGDKHSFEGDLAFIEWDSETEEADKVDYALAVCCGAVSGIVDALFVGEFSLERAREWGSSQVESFVKRLGNWERRRDGKKDSDNLADLIEYLEKAHGMAADAATDVFGGGRQHHFRDFSHHFSPVGLACSLFTQFTGVKCGMDANGNMLYTAKAVGTDPSGAFRVVTIKSPFIGSNFEEKFLYGTIEWLLHLASDMAGSHLNAGGGTGIPGPVVSMLKEISSLPFFRPVGPVSNRQNEGMSFRLWLSKLFNGTLLAHRDENGNATEPFRFDLRMEIGISSEIGRQVIPVIINECLVRAVYFLRRLFLEVKAKNIMCPSDLKGLESKRLLPFNNPAVRRMVTVSTGAMVAADAADALVRSLVKNKDPRKGAFWADFVVRINVAGVGRFFVACAVDAKSTVREARWRRLVDEKRGDEFARDIACFDVLTLTTSQYRLLLSLEKLMLDYDIRLTRKAADQEAKKRWCEEWEHRVLEPIPLLDHKAELYFVDALELFGLIDKEIRDARSSAWIHLLLLEAAFFTPYKPSFEDGNGGKPKIEQESDYLDDVFCARCPGIDRKELTALRKAAKRYRSSLMGKKTKRVVGIVGTGALALGTAGAAAFLAPVIAPALATTLFGGTVVGLSGAALTSASLALLGGGSLATGGLGMAGGTAVIAGGGALLGIAGGSGLTTAASIQAFGSEKLVFNECVKMLAYSDVVLVNTLDRRNEIVSIEERLSLISSNLESAQTQLKETPGSNRAKKGKGGKQAKIVKRSSKYIEKTCGLLRRMAAK